MSGADDQAGFNAGQIFIDVDAIEAGTDFREEIIEAVENCDVFLAVIGKRWASLEDANGRRRLDNPEDWVRREIETALERRVPLVPVLVDRASMPKANELPESLAEFASRQSVELTDTRWHEDVRRLLGSLKKREAAKLAGNPFGVTFSRFQKREYEEWVAAHPEGDVVEGWCKSASWDHATIELTPEVSGWIPGRFLQPGEAGSESDVVNFRTVGGGIITFGQRVRVRVRNVSRNPDSLSGWSIELALVEGLPDNLFT